MPASRGDTTTEAPSGLAAFEELCAALRPLPADEGSFTGRPWPVPWGVPYGGLLVAQAYAAAAQTVRPGFWARSLHAYFLQAGRDDQPVDIDVTTVRDARGTSWRSVDVLQRERTLLRAELMFSLDTEGPTHQHAMPAVADPAELDNVGDVLAPFEHDTSTYWGRHSPFDLRYVTGPPRVRAEQGPAAPRSAVWLRAQGSADGDRTLATALLVYASDMCMLDPCLRAQGMWLGPGSAEGRSVDHSMWFHATPRVDDWLLMDQRSPGTRDGRALGMAEMYAADGELLCSIAQHGWIRPVDR